MRILIVDDHHIFRKTFIRFLSNIDELTKHVFGEASNGVEALQKIKDGNFDAVFLDVSMPVMDGYEACKWIRINFPQVAIIMLTQYDDHHLVYHFYNAGVKSFLTKDASESDILKALKSVAENKSYFPDDVIDIIQHCESGNMSNFEISPQEKKIIDLLHLGHTSKNIADKLGLSIKTVCTYRERLLLKTNTANVAELISFGFRNGLIATRQSPM